MGITELSAGVSSYAYVEFHFVSSEIIIQVKPSKPSYILEIS